MSHFIACLCFFFSAAANAQIVNIESKRMQTDTIGWSGSLGTTFSFTKNVQEVLNLNANAHVQYKTENSLYLFLADYNLLKGDQQELANNMFYHLRYNRRVNNWLRWEVFNQWQQNAVTGIRLRTLFGTGPRFKIHSSERFRLYAATAAMYEYEEEQMKPAVFHRDLRSSSYLSFSYTPNPVFEIVSTSFYQPLFNQLNDYRIMNQIALNIKLTRRLLVTTSWDYLYDAFPAGNNPGSNFTLTNGFTYTF
jgi:hypothetical protein